MNHLLFWLLSVLTVSQEDLRFHNVFKQNYDTSCGISATASLLNKYWNVPVTEADMFREMLPAMIDSETMKYTVSFTTISEYLNTHGIMTRAYSMDWDMLLDTLAKGFGPIIIHYIHPRPHFALLLHIEQGHAFVADPSRGLEIMDRRAFTGHFSGNVLLAASQSRKKDTEYLEQVIRAKQKKLTRLKRLAGQR